MKLPTKLFLIVFLTGFSFYGGMFANGGAQLVSRAWTRITPYKEKTPLLALIKKNAPEYSLKKEFSLGGLKGAVLESTSGKQIVSWLLEDHLILGNVFSKDGADLTSIAARQHNAHHPIDALMMQLQQPAAGEDISRSFTREEIEAMPGAILAGTEGRVKLYMVSWSGCPACTAMKNFLATAQLPFAVKICPIGGRPQTDRDGLQMLGFDAASQNAPEAGRMKERLHKTHDLVERALGRATVPCLFWLEGETVKFMIPKSGQDVKDIIAKLQ